MNRRCLYVLDTKLSVCYNIASVNFLKGRAEDFLPCARTYTLKFIFLNIQLILFILLRI